MQFHYTIEMAGSPTHETICWTYLTHFTINKTDVPIRSRHNTS